MRYVDVLMVIMKIGILLRSSLPSAKLLRIMSRSHDLDIETIEIEIEIEIECWGKYMEWDMFLEKDITEEGSPYRCDLKTRASYV